MASQSVYLMLVVEVIRLTGTDTMDWREDKLRRRVRKRDSGTSKSNKW